MSSISNLSVMILLEAAKIKRAMFLEIPLLLAIEETAAYQPVLYVGFVHFLYALCRNTYSAFYSFTRCTYTAFLGLRFFLLLSKVFCFLIVKLSFYIFFKL